MAKVTCFVKLKLSSIIIKSTLTGKMMLSAVAPQARVGWSFSSCEVVPLEQILHMHTFLLSYDLILLLVLLLSLDQSPAQAQVTSLPVEPLERLGEQAAPRVQLLMLAESG